MNFLYKSLSCFGFIFLALFSLQLNASVIMTGTRIIYNEGSRSVDVNLKNQSNFPYVVQTWFDAGKMSGGPDASVQVPFIATPPVFRIQPGAGQVVKVTFTGGLNLPDDRESVFYFNFLQVPPSNIDKNDVKNKMLVMLRNRVKIFYRSTSLVSGPGRGFPNISVTPVSGNASAVMIKNHTPFYVTVSSVALTEGQRRLSSGSGMIEPSGTQIFNISRAGSVKGRKAIVTVVNDRGARLNAEFGL
ncbi:fimbria/pilus periplasmic chaperone [Klebsiella grimontii]|uniref:Fimbria/pilus periplasmic chaperone n=2 Tax=Klebsiella grimontii TaxID=2058152 RepID=A0A839CIP8_9ENTR|nr:fimbria/pilus periplasmic chaperone [Klebsiella grimontii]MBA8006757.1 fimbria/pilus periplasmic chaperone [Klebsiella grimontii]MBA8124980.1 fimbria/pilus periplasmic chaperone [Klebsiella grimontii]QLP40471.1 fimbria/pilus periplasmic chaperone [Klebsiella grimontii]QLU55134.1 fimbria/pilus periplasmic chaperone [Klebsiella grimontii]